MTDPFLFQNSYHPEKPQRMVSLIAQYLNNEIDAIGKWSWSEGMASGKACTARPSEKGKPTPKTSSGLFETVKARAVAMAGRGVSGTWAGHSGFVLSDDGGLKTPWGEGTWGAIPTLGTAEAGGTDRLFFDFAGTKHMVEGFTTEKQKGGELFMTSVRCADGEKVEIVL